MTNFFPLRRATTLVACSSGGPRSDFGSEGGRWGVSVGGRWQRGWIVIDGEVADEEAVLGDEEEEDEGVEDREWTAGARMNIAGKGMEGFERP